MSVHSPIRTTTPLLHRQGVVIPPGLPGKAWSNHCQMPTPYLLPDGKTLRMFFCSRDSNNRSHVFFVDMLARPPWTLVSKSASLVLSPGLPGTFDAVGVMPTAIVPMGDELWMYYIGWSQRLDVPYHNAIGLARSRDHGKTFERFLPGPVVGTGLNEPYFCGTADVEHRSENDWVMWYMSTTEWRMDSDRPEPRYHLKKAVSSDGINWDHGTEIAVDYIDENEGGIARATVLSGRNGHWMWFCHRGVASYRGTGNNAYRLGLACSHDGESWTRLTDPKIFADCEPDQTFDAFMQCYPAVFETDSESYLFYNGSDFGQTGIGVAKIDFV